MNDDEAKMTLGHGWKLTQFFFDTPKWVEIRVIAEDEACPSIRNDLSERR